MTTSRDVVVSEFELGRKGWVRATLNEFRGKRYASVRLYVEPRDQPGAELIPTKAGLTVEVSYLDELLEAVQALQEAAGVTTAQSAQLEKRHGRGRDAA
jgi:Transcriptional Coactivator p15 (PC4)